MSPQVYYEVDKKRDSKIIKEIKANNTEVNKRLSVITEKKLQWMILRRLPTLFPMFLGFQTGKEY